LENLQRNETMNSASNNTKLMIAGPMPLHPEVLASLSTPMISHRSREFSSIFSETIASAKHIFKTTHDVVILPCSGTGGLEAVVSNFMSPGDSVAVAINGFFGDRFADIMRAYGIEPILVKVDWGRPVLAKDVVETIQRHPDVKAVFVVHNETSTGVISEIADISRAVKAINPNILVVVDAVSSLGGADIRTDKWNLDVVVSSTQKALMAPPGLCIISISDAAWQSMEFTSSPRYYLDLRRIRKEGQQGMTLVTPPVPIVFGLKKALQLLLQEGLQNVFKRNLEMRDKVISAIKPLGIKLVAKEKYASPTMSALRLPPGISSQEFRDHVEARYSLLLAPGLGPLAHDCFRIGHMGYVAPSDISATMSVLKRALGHFN